jgi:hypothetical protein
LGCGLGVAATATREEGVGVKRGEPFAAEAVGAKEGLVIAEALDFGAWDEQATASVEGAGADLSAGGSAAGSLDGRAGDLGRGAVPGYVGGDVGEDGACASAYFDGREFVVAGERREGVVELGELGLGVLGALGGFVVAETAADATPSFVFPEFESLQSGAAATAGRFGVLAVRVRDDNAEQAGLQSLACEVGSQRVKQTWDTGREADSGDSTAKDEMKGISAGFSGGDGMTRLTRLLSVGKIVRGPRLEFLPRNFGLFVGCQDRTTPFPLDAHWSLAGTDLVRRCNFSLRVFLLVFLLLLLPSLSALLQRKRRV